MAENNEFLHEFFIPEDIDKQIERVRQAQEGDPRDAEALAYLHSFYSADAQQEQVALNRIWNRIAGAPLYAQTLQENEKIIPMQQPYSHSQNGGGVFSTAGRSRTRRNPWGRRLGLVAAAIFLIALVGSMALVFNAAHRTIGSPHPTPPIITPRVPLKVTSVSMSVMPGSISGIACGTRETVTYTADFHVVPNSVGGTVQFTYSVNNGRSQTPASITFNPGETSKTYDFSWSDVLPLDHTNPGLGGVQVTSPNSLTSAMVKPTGGCSAAAFSVTNVAMAVSPTSIQGLACGSSIAVTYTATIHIAPNSAGGTVQFNYTVNNGRGLTPANISFKPGETSKVYNFTWSGALPADHSYPGPGGIQVTSPNQLTSAFVAPTGQCTVQSAFSVTNVAMSVSPASIQGLACGSSIVVTYTATISVAPNSPGGTVQFNYTINNGRGQTPASITFSPGQTVRTYSFTWSGALPLDHTYPTFGGIQVTSPNALTSQLVEPTGKCS